MEQEVAPIVDETPAATNNEEEVKVEEEEVEDEQAQD